MAVKRVNIVVQIYPLGGVTIRYREVGKTESRWGTRSII